MTEKTSLEVVLKARESSDTRAHVRYRQLVITVAAGEDSRMNARALDELFGRMEITNEDFTADVVVMRDFMSMRDKCEEFEANRPELEAKLAKLTTAIQKAKENWQFAERKYTESQHARTQAGSGINKKRKWREQMARIQSEHPRLFDTEVI